MKSKSFSNRSVDALVSASQFKHELSLPSTNEIARFMQDYLTSASCGMQATTLREQAFFNEMIGELVDEDESMCIFQKDANLRFVYVNEAFCESVGLNAKKIIGLNDFELFGSQYAQLYMNRDLDVLQSRERRVYTHEPHPNSSGMPDTVSVSKDPIVIGNKCVGIIGSFQWQLSSEPAEPETVGSQLGPCSTIS